MIKNITVFIWQSSLYFQVTPFVWDESFRHNSDTTRNDLSVGSESVRNGRQALLRGNLDKNLILFVTLWAGLCEDFHCRRNMGQPLAAVRGSSPLRSIIYTSQEWKPTMQHCVSVAVTIYMFVSRGFSHVWVQRTMLLFFWIARWYWWPAVNESRSASLQISKGDWGGLDTSHIWQHCLKACWWRKYKHPSPGTKVT